MNDLTASPSATLPNLIECFLACQSDLSRSGSRLRHRQSRSAVC